MLRPLLLAVLIAITACTTFRDTAIHAANAARLADAEAAIVISQACQAAYRGAHNADDIAAADSVCRPALDAYDVAEAAREALMAAIDAGDEPGALGAQARLLTASAKLAAEIDRVRRGK